MDDDGTLMRHPISGPPDSSDQLPLGIALPGRPITVAEQVLKTFVA
ncbi:hypothetical protein [Amycolatopsis sp. 3B14]